MVDLGTLFELVVGLAVCEGWESTELRNSKFNNDICKRESGSYLL